MTKTIGVFAVSFPEFKLSEIINPDEANANNADITDKLNELITQSNVLSSDGYVGTDQLADGSVIDVKLGDGSILEAKIADGAVTSVKISQDSVQTAHIADGAVSSDKIKKLTVRGDNIAPTTISIDKVVLADFDSRYYTKNSANTLLDSKTDKVGDHQGTWHGLTPESFDPDGAILDLSELKNQVNDHIYDSFNPHGTTWKQIELSGFEAMSHIARGTSYTYVVDPSSIDANGTYTIVDFYIGSLKYKKHTMSLADGNGRYTSLSIDYYDSDENVIDTVEHIISYDENGSIVGVV